MEMPPTAVLYKRKSKKLIEITEDWKSFRIHLLNYLSTIIFPDKVSFKTFTANSKAKKRRKSIKVCSETFFFMKRRRKIAIFQIILLLFTFVLNVDFMKIQNEKVFFHLTFYKTDKHERIFLFYFFCRLRWNRKGITKYCIHLNVI